MSKTFHYDNTLGFVRRTLRYGDTLGFVPDDDVPQKLCINCKSHCVWAGKDGEPEHKKCLVGYTPITNADRIRSMTDEELAEWLSDMHDTVTCPNNGAIDCNPSCKRCWLDWLKQSAEEGEK